MPTENVAGFGSLLKSKPTKKANKMAPMLPIWLH